MWTSKHFFLNKVIKYIEREVRRVTGKHSSALFAHSDAPRAGVRSGGEINLAYFDQFSVW